MSNMLAHRISLEEKNQYLESVQKVLDAIEDGNWQLGSKGSQDTVARGGSVDPKRPEKNM